MAKQAIEKHGISIRLACECLGISQTCYRYLAKLGDDNARIADWLVRLTHNYRACGFCLCFLFLRNVTGYGWNLPPVSRIYRELALNRPIKPQKSLIRDTPYALTMPEPNNEV